MRATTALTPSADGSNHPRADVQLRQILQVEGAVRHPHKFWLQRGDFGDWAAAERRGATGGP
jgi:hypothetical protein